MRKQTSLYVNSLRLGLLLPDWMPLAACSSSYEALGSRAYTNSIIECKQINLQAQSELLVRACFPFVVESHLRLSQSWEVLLNILEISKLHS